MVKRYEIKSKAIVFKTKNDEILAFALFPELTKKSDSPPIPVSNVIVTQVPVSPKPVSTFPTIVPANETS